MNPKSILTGCAILWGLSVAGCGTNQSRVANDSSESTTPATIVRATLLPPTKILPTTTVSSLAESTDVSDQYEGVVVEDGGGLTLEQQRALEDAMNTTDWAVNAQTVPNASGYQVTVTITQALNELVAAPILTITSLNGAYPTTVPQGCTVDTENIFCPLEGANPSGVYPATLVVQFPPSATQLNIVIDPRSDIELAPANNTTTLNLTNKS